MDLVEIFRYGNRVGTLQIKLLGIGVDALLKAGDGGKDKLNVPQTCHGKRVSDERNNRADVPSICIITRASVGTTPRSPVSN